MPITLEIDARLLGRKQPLLAGWSLALPPALAQPGESLALRDLIGQVVREEVAAYEQRQAERRLARVLMPGEIERGAARGKIDLGEREAQPPVEADAAVAAALQAFEDGLYFVFVEGEQVASLEAPVRLADRTRVSFVRLVALAGG
jgi:hypothetical protein